jgi:hypothetical protein
MSQVLVDQKSTQNFVKNIIDFVVIHGEKRKYNGLLVPCED